MIPGSTISIATMDDHSSKLVSLVIIDDNPRSLEFVSSALARDGLAIYTASDPAEGLDLVYTHRPQIVITDLVMPGMTGLDVLSRIMEFDPAIDVTLMQSANSFRALRRGRRVRWRCSTALESLASTQGNQAEAARHLHIGRDALRYKMKRHGLL